MSDGTIDCGHCFATIPFEYHFMTFIEDVDAQIIKIEFQCDACGRDNFILQINPRNESLRLLDKRISIWPFLNDRHPCPPEVPSYISEDYQEACLVLKISPKASAALSRRCLQNLLHNAAGVKPDKLVKEIEEVIGSGKLPSQITDSIQAIRHIGNFAAHPDENKSTGEIMPVEPHEAEWSLDILESLFDFYYVQPARNAQKRAALNAKFQETGKQPPMK